MTWRVKLADTDPALVSARQLYVPEFCNFVLITVNLDVFVPRLCLAPEKEVDVVRG